MIDVSEHLGLAIAFARQYERRCRTGTLELDDLIQAACLGLMRAAEDFDPSRASWSTYATWWMRYTVGRELSNHSRTIRVPVHALERGHGSLPTSSLDAPLGDDDRGGWHEVLAAEQPEPRDCIAEARLAAAVAALPERQRCVIRGRFWGERGLKELGVDWGVSRERIRELKGGALDALALAFAG